MTAIPDATAEDFAGIRNTEEVYAETEEILKGYGLMDCNDKIAIESVLELAYLRIIAHFQRENERLARQRDVLRKYIRGIAGDHALEVAKGWNETELIDALSGEGGGV